MSLLDDLDEAIDAAGSSETVVVSSKLLYDIHQFLVRAEQRRGWIAMADKLGIPMEAVSSDVGMVDSYHAARNDWERKWLKSLLKRHNGNVTHAAAASGIDVRTLHRIKRKRSI